MKKSIIKDTLRYTTANNFAQGLGIINSIVLRRFMGPEAMGIWTTLQVLLGYCGYASFGTTRAMARDYPYLRGRGEHGKAEELKDMTLTFSLIMSVLPMLLIWFYLGFKFKRLELPFAVGLAFLSLFLFFQRFYDLVITLLRSDKKFEILSRLIVLNAVGTFLVSFCFVSLWNIYGLFVGTVLVTAFCLFFIFRSHRYHFRYYWDSRRLLKELKLGIPLVATSFLLEFLRGLDRLLIAQKLGFYEVGLYSIAIMVNSYVFSLPMMFAHVWYPNLQEAYGRGGGDARVIKNYLTTPVSIFTTLIPFLCGLGIFIVPLLVDLFLPRFTDGLSAMKVYLMGSYFLILAQLSSNFLVTIDRYLIEIPILIISVILNGVFNLFFLNVGLGILGVAIGTTLSFCFYGIASFVMAMRYVEDGKESLAHMVQMTLILSALFAAIYLIDLSIRLPNLYGEVLLKIFLLALFSFPFFWRLEKQTAVFRSFLDHLKGAKSAQKT